MARITQFDKAKICFEHAIKFDDSIPEPFFGIAICSIKKNDIMSGLKYAELAAKLATKYDKNSPLYFYIVALSNKLLENIEQAENSYHLFRNCTTKIKPIDVKNLIFGFLLSFLIKDKSLLVSHSKKYETLCKKSDINLINYRKITSQLSKYFNEDGKWNNEKELKVSLFLHKYPFMCRFSISQIDRKSVV